MYRVIEPAHMRAMEKAYMKRTDTEGLLLMERAAEAVVQALLEMTREGALFLCGPGNNGGDGYAAARLYVKAGRSAIIWTLFDPESLTGDARTNWRRCEDLGIAVRVLEEMPGQVPQGIGVIVDALFGTGLARPLEGLSADAVKWMNGSGLPVLAVDMPSGTAERMVRAQRTVTFHRRKTPHAFFPGRVNAGEITAVDIGLPQTPLADEFTVLEPGDVSALLPPRPAEAHKGTAGHAVILAGSEGMAGAAALCANGALRGGAGLVTVACPTAVRPVVQTLAPCAMCIPTDRLMAFAAGKPVLAVGPGLGSSHEVETLLAAALSVPCRQVWDADALNWLAGQDSKLSERFVITPHPGEAARLLGETTYQVTADPAGAARRLHVRYRAVVLLKGATTVIIGAKEQALNLTGTPGMATGGSGDVLTGLIAALIAQGLSPFDAARLGALLHGMAGERAAKARGIRSMTAQDIVDFLYID